MELGNSKIKTQAQALSLSSGILARYWDLRNSPGWILGFFWFFFFYLGMFLAFQVVSEHTKLRLELP